MPTNTEHLRIAVIVEDEPTWQRLLQELFNDAWNVIVVSSLWELFSLQVQPDLLSLDANLRGRRTLDRFNEIRMKFPDARLVFVTSDTPTRELAEAESIPFFKKDDFDMGRYEEIIIGKRE